MTVPSGYPDWQHIDVKTGVPLFNQTLNVQSATTEGPFFVGNYSYLQLGVTTSSTGTYQVQLIWTSDQAGLVQVASTLYTLGGNQNALNVCPPTLAPWVKIVLTPISVALSDRITLIVTPMGERAAYRDMSTGIIADVARVSIANGVTRDDLGNFTAPGRARWFFGLDGSSGVFTVMHLLPAGTYERTFTIGPVTGPSFQEMNLSLLPYQIKVETQNTGASTANFWNVLGTED